MSQSEVADAFSVDTRQGLQRLLPDMIRRGAELRDEVDDERDWDEGRIDWRRRRIFEDFSQTYGDGTWLSVSLQVLSKRPGFGRRLRRRVT